MKILLYCIFTNEYVKLIKPWVESVGRNFYPGQTDILIVTDNTDIIENKDGLIIKEIKSSVIRNEELWKKYRRHMDILDEYKNSYDFFVNIQANCLLFKEINEENFPLPKDKLTVFAHSSTGQRELVATNMCKIGSYAYRSAALYDGIYTHAGMTFGTYELMYKMNKDCYNYYLSDMQNDKLYKVPYNDESYINTWRVDNKDLVNILPSIASGLIENAETCGNPFFLVDKECFGIKKNTYICPKFIQGTRLGNWLFLIATCYAHARRNGYDMKLPHMKQLPRNVREHFAIDIKEDIKGKYKEPYYHYSPIPAEAKGYFSGFFQSSKYFDDYRDELRYIFSDYVSRYVCEYMAAIHIRMGDYLVYTDRYKSPDKDYLERAIAKLSPEIKEIVILSDDMNKAKKLIESCNISKRFTFDYEKRDETDSIFQMTMASELIMSCSSFSWWGAYLGKHKQVIVDDKWYKDNALVEKDIYEKDWIRI